ncbi:MAG: type II toxin-antitoxin system RelE/ParE family toxin [Alphaproteobacteria bacterium]|nr:type II toxin-antitoxin system RelE/ParE family toxin [Alphaproteobacteria bacterium]
MARYLLSKAAERDINQIADYTITSFGLDQARRYRDDLTKLFSSLAENPLMGRDHGHIRPGYRRHIHARHSIYYRVRDDRIEIMRILHERQDPLRHL